MIREIKGLAELLLESLSARVTMRLEHRNNPAMTACSGCRKCCCNFCWMVAVVVHNRAELRVVNDFKPPASTAKCVQRCGNFFKWNSDLRSQRNDCQSVQGVVCSRNIERHTSQSFSIAHHIKMGAEISRC